MSFPLEMFALVGRSTMKRQVNDVTELFQIELRTLNANVYKSEKYFVGILYGCNPV